MSNPTNDAEKPTDGARQLFGRARLSPQEVMSELLLNTARLSSLSARDAMTQANKVAEQVLQSSNETIEREMARAVDVVNQAVVDMVNATGEQLGETSRRVAEEGARVAGDASAGAGDATPPQEKE